MNEPLPEMKCLVVRRLAKTKIKGIVEYLITNGTNAGRWTLQFGSNCLADSFDCREFARNVHNETPGSEVTEYLCLPVS